MMKKSIKSLPADKPKSRNKTTTEDMKSKKFIIIVAALLLLIGCDTLSCLNFMHSAWKHNGGVRISDFLYPNEEYGVTTKWHTLTLDDHTVGYFILSVGRSALIYTINGKDEENCKGIALYTKK